MDLVVSCSFILYGRFTSLGLCLFYYSTRLGLLVAIPEECLSQGRKKIVYSGVRWTATLVAFTLTLGLAIEARYVYKNYLSKGRKSQTENVLFPSHVSLAKGTLLSLDGFTNSKSCGASGCHEEIYRQWEESVHYRTPNPFVIKTAELLNSEADKGLFKTPHTNHKGPEVFKVCAACHSPVGLVTGQINLDYGDFKKHEGASCVLCHKMSNVKMNGQWVSYEVEQKMNSCFQNPIMKQLLRCTIALLE